MSPPADGPLERFSRRLRSCEPQQAIVVVPPRGDTRTGFELARELMSAGNVRLVGHGVTLKDTWPEWAADSTLQMTELGAYLDRPLPEETTRERHDLRAWLNAVFGRVVDGLPGGLDARTEEGVGGAADTQVFGGGGLKQLLRLFPVKAQRHFSVCMLPLGNRR